MNISTSLPLLLSVGKFFSWGGGGNSVGWSQEQELDSMILMGPFQLSKFYDIFFIYLKLICTKSNHLCHSKWTVQSFFVSRIPLKICHIIIPASLLIWIASPLRRGFVHWSIITVKSCYSHERMKHIWAFWSLLLRQLFVVKWEFFVKNNRKTNFCPRISLRNLEILSWEDSSEVFFL